MEVIHATQDAMSHTAGTSPAQEQRQTETAPRRALAAATDQSCVLHLRAGETGSMA